MSHAPDPHERSAAAVFVAILGAALLVALVAYLSFSSPAKP